MQKSILLSTVTCVLFTSGCIERPGTPIGPEIGFGQNVSVQGGGVSAVDLLFVIDDSGSMRDEQANIAIQIPQLVRDLASPPDHDGDGAPDWAAVESLRIAIANTDVGTGSYTYPSSTCVEGGADGMLHGAGVYEWETGDDPDAFAAAVGAVVENIGLSGCAFEQQLEATARALERGTDVGFPRHDALLAIMLVTDEDDCSVVDDAAYFSTAGDAPNAHCIRNLDGLTSVSELLAQIRGERSDDEIVFAAITGIPRDVSADATTAEILAHPDMANAEINPSAPEPRPACEYDDPVSGLSKAAPARRIVEMAGMLPGSVLHSICTDDFGPAIREIAARIGERIPGVCLARALPDLDNAPCSVSVSLPVGDTCDGFPGYTLTEVDDEGRELCAVAQVVAGSGEDGWYYDPADASCPQLVLTEASVPPLTSDLRAECFFTVYRELGEQCARASQCESGWCDPMERVCAPLPVDDGPSMPTGS